MQFLLQNKLHTVGGLDCENESRSQPETLMCSFNSTMELDEKSLVLWNAGQFILSHNNYVNEWTLKYSNVIPFD